MGKRENSQKAQEDDSSLTSNKKSQKVGFDEAKYDSMTEKSLDTFEESGNQTFAPVLNYENVIKYTCD